MLLVLDSTILIDFLRGRPAVERVRGLRSRGVVPATTAINVDELVRGMHPGEDMAIQRLLDGLVVLDINAEAAWLAGSWRRHSASQGRTLSQSDCLIGATAKCGFAVLATGNPKDFDLPDLQVEHWPVGA